MRRDGSSGAEQQLIEQGVPIKRIMDMCDPHAQAVQDLIVEESYALVPPGHPMDTFRGETTALRELAAQLLAALEELAAGEGEPAPALAARVRADCALLMDVDKHAAPRSSAGWAAVASEIAEPTIAALESMIVKEERILLPMALRQLMHGRFLHVRYFAVRDDASAYLGTLEVTQNLTRERALQSERRLLQYES